MLAHSTHYSSISINILHSLVQGASERRNGLYVIVSFCSVHSQLTVLGPRRGALYRNNEGGLGSWYQHHRHRQYLLKRRVRVSHRQVHQTGVLYGVLN